MKKKFPITLLSHTAIGITVAIGSFLLISNSTYAQELPTTEPLKVEVQPTEIVQQVNLEGEETLKSNVSFEVKQRPLRDLLTDLQQQTDVVLTISPNPKLESALVTARVKALPLSKVMDSLARLYGVSWIKVTDAHYRMSDSQFPIDATLAPLGDLRWFRYWREAARREVAPKDLSFEYPSELVGEIFNDVTFAEIATIGQVPLKVLAPEVKIRLRQEIEDRVAISLLRNLQSISTEQLKQGSLSINIIKPKSPTRQEYAEVTVRSSNGALSTDLFSFPVRIEADGTIHLDEQPFGENKIP
ncbi:hypothetical protein EON83_24890 [bacterium]|nr:MAG: hypothetical protein EON83_24890 [bacterium]